jgi:hypothetical protein
MGKRTTVESDQQPSGKEIRIPADTTIKVFNSTFDEVKETIDGANDDLKTAAGEAKKKHLSLSAFKDVKKLYDMFRKAKNQSIASEKLAAYLANFDVLRKYYKLDEKANLQSRLLPAGEIGAEAEDGQADMRPSHLRQPGASVTSLNPVQELAAKTGATMPGGQDDLLGKVGRGNKPH